MIQRLILMAFVPFLIRGRVFSGGKDKRATVKRAGAQLRFREVMPETLEGWMSFNKLNTHVGFQHNLW